jgi:hypothetical protein
MKEAQRIIFQLFDLNSCELMNQEQQIQTPLERWEKVKKVLKTYGFSLMEDSCQFKSKSGVPMFIMVGMPEECGDLFDELFLGLIREYKLPFLRGKRYREEFGINPSLNLLSDINYLAFAPDDR